MVLQFSNLLLIEDTDCPNDSIFIVLSSEPDILDIIFIDTDLFHFGFDLLSRQDVFGSDLDSGSAREINPKIQSEDEQENDPDNGDTD